MRKLILLNFVLFAISLFAQENQGVVLNQDIAQDSVVIETTAVDSKTLDSTKPLKNRYNAIKFNLTSIIFRNYQLTYERILNKRWSISFSGSMIPKGKLPHVDRFDLDDEEIKDLEIASNVFTFEPRLYVSKRGYGHGFYLAPYYRYSTFEITGYDYSDEIENEDIHVNFSGDIESHNGGIMIGSQWFLGKKDNFTLDIWFIGGHYGVSSGTFDGITNQNLTPIQQQLLEESLNDMDDIPEFIDYKATVLSPNSAKIEVDGPWAGLRAGIALGIRF